MASGGGGGMNPMATNLTADGDLDIQPLPVAALYTRNVLLLVALLFAVAAHCVPVLCCLMKRRHLSRATVRTASEATKPRHSGGVEAVPQSTAAAGTSADSATVGATNQGSSSSSGSYTYANMMRNCKGGTCQPTASPCPYREYLRQGHWWAYFTGWCICTLHITFLVAVAGRVQGALEYGPNGVGRAATGPITALLLCIVFVACGAIGNVYALVRYQRLRHQHRSSILAPVSAYLAAHPWAWLIICSSLLLNGQVSRVTDANVPGIRWTQLPIFLDLETSDPAVNVMKVSSARVRHRCSGGRNCDPCCATIARLANAHLTAWHFLCPFLVLILQLRIRRQNAWLRTLSSAGPLVLPVSFGVAQLVTGPDHPFAPGSVTGPSSQSIPIGVALIIMFVLSLALFVLCAAEYVCMGRWLRAAERSSLGADQRAAQQPLVAAGEIERRGPLPSISADQTIQVSSPVLQAWETAAGSSDVQPPAESAPEERKEETPPLAADARLHQASSDATLSERMRWSSSHATVTTSADEECVLPTQ